ncbi:MAG: nucleoside monophosphate kinase [Mycoplasmataceae bacterium]|jgi:adenylate kinase|nr:nucleoside monophosphate kinase [Mycoplasmataceae bacterium]
MVIVLIGAPGAGKGTLSNMLISDYNFVHISTGDLIRDEIDSGSELGKKLKAITSTGALVDSNIVYTLLLNAAEKARKKKYSIVFDGFPRNLEQTEWLEKECKPDVAIYLRCDLKTVIARLSTRRVCPKCNATTNTRTDPKAKKGICAECGAQLISRSDDSPNTITNRYRIFEENNQAIIDYYKNANILKVIDGTRNKKYVAAVAARLFKKLNK